MIKSVVEELKLFSLSEELSDKEMIYNLFRREPNNPNSQLPAHIPFPSP